MVAVRTEGTRAESARTSGDSDLVNDGCHGLVLKAVRLAPSDADHGLESKTVAPGPWHPIPVACRIGNRSRSSYISTGAKYVILSGAKDPSSTAQPGFKRRRGLAWKRCPAFGPAGARDERSFAPLRMTYLVLLVLV